VPVILSMIGATLGIIIYPLSATKISKPLYTFLNNK